MKDAPTREERAGAEGRDPQTEHADSIPETPTGTDRNSLLSAAQGYLARGLTPIRLGPKSKKPLGKHDDNTITADNAGRLLNHGGYNLGLRLGPDHGGLVDFDLDWPQARRLGGLLLSQFARFGREGARGSHYLLRGDGPVASKKYDMPELKGVDGLPDEHATCVLEVRATGYTMAPPSVHPTGAPVEWERDAALLEEGGSGIHRRAGLLAFLSVVARFYPAQGSRDDFCMALAGALLAAGLSPGEADRCIVAVAEAAGDEEAGKRRKAGQTAVKVEAGEPATGIPRVVEMLGLPEAVTKRFRDWLGISEGRADDRVRVVVNYNRRHEMLDAVDEALSASGLPLYQSARAVVTPMREGGGPLRLSEVSAVAMQEYMTQAVNFVKVVSKADGSTVDAPAWPEKHFAEGYVARAQRGALRLPRCRGLVGHPTIRPDGSLMWAEGFDPDSGLIVDHGGVEFPPVPDAPTREEGLAALAKLKQVIKEFPFVGDGSRSVALSAMLTAVCRRSLDFAPVHAFNAPSPETGKSLLSDIPSMMVTGQPAAKHAQERDPEEDQKSLLGVLLQGDPVVVTDNVERPIEGAAWCLILTSPEWEKRGLGANGPRRVLTNVLFIFNGNNIEFRGDMATRAVMATIDAGVEEPAARTFDVDLREDVPRRRGELVSAALTVLRAHAVAGFPGARGETRFPGWSRLVRGALIWLGEADPWDTRHAVRGGDSARDEAVRLTEALSACFGSEPFAARDVCEQADTFAVDRPTDGQKALSAVLEAMTPTVMRPRGGPDAAKVGMMLRRRRDQIARGRAIVQVGHDKLRGNLYQVREMATPPPSPR